MTRSTVAIRNAASKILSNAIPNRKEPRLEEILKEELFEMQAMEQMQLDMFPELLKGASSEDLQEIIIEHQRHTAQHLKRLRLVLIRLGADPEKPVISEVMGSLVKKSRMPQQYPEGPLRDVAITVCLQKTEYVEIAAYKALCELCEALGFYKIGEILDHSLSEEELVARELNELLAKLNTEACMRYDESYIKMN